MEVILHFHGLAKDQHSSFVNRRGVNVSIDSGEYVIIDTEMNPNWKQCIVDGIARSVDRVPDGVDFLYENSEPRRPRISPSWGDGPPPRGAFALYGVGSNPEQIAMADGRTVTVLDLSENELEEVRQRYMPFELDFTDARKDKRAGRPVHTLTLPFHLNFFVLVRIAWLICREKVRTKIDREMHEWEQDQIVVRKMGLLGDPVRRPSRSETREEIERKTAGVLVEWGILRRNQIPDRATIYRDMKSALLTVGAVDRLILGSWKDLVEAGQLPPRTTPLQKPNK